MNEVIETILKRRSTRFFADKQIDDETLNHILAAGLYAPSAHNQQTWHFTVVQDQTLLDTMSVIAKREAMSSTEASIVKMAASERFHIFYHAPTVILISADLSKMMPYEDCSAATQNMLLAAESLGIGSCWIGFVKRFYTSTDYNAYKERLAIPSHMTPIHAVSLGYKLQEDLAAPKRKLPKVNFVR